MGAGPIPKLTVEDYLALDRAAEFKSEYHDGEIFPMVAVSIRHAEISVALASALKARLAGKPCRALIALRVRVSPRQYVQPDLTIVCGPPQLTDEHEDTLVNPRVIVEILSPSTADYGAKFRLYRQLPSLGEYVLVAQDEPQVEVELYAVLTFEAAE